jgi:hypothetical protein
VSHKAGVDKTREGYPFTARQKRRLLGNRVSRKNVRPAKKSVTRVRKSAPRRK